MLYHHRRVAGLIALDPKSENHLVTTRQMNLNEVCQFKISPVGIEPASDSPFEMVVGHHGYIPHLGG